ncbi:MAG TPA: aminoglycoside phosphotransferase family protein [Caulobacteraceae bacterium]|jgi:aminoglycoside phosphotransferase (APT) family kinase protein
MSPPAGRVRIDADLVRRLVAVQFPAWADLPVAPVVPGGHDNRTFRLGEAMLARLPSAERYAAQVEKEQRWLPRLAPALPLPIPAPLAVGAAGEGYPWPWSVLRWLPGETAAARPPADLVRFARETAGFLAALQGIDAAGGPTAGPHSFWRGGPLATYDAEARAAIAALAGDVDAHAALRLWDAAREAHCDDAPVWLHGDVAAGNLLVDAVGRLSAVIDFGCCAVGDPACDLVLAWTLFDAPSRAAFREALPLDGACWARAAGWVLWKAALIVAGDPRRDPAEYARQRRALAGLLAGGQATGS